MISIMIFSGVAPAQTTRARPRIDSNDPANYRYAYQHGYKAGYEDGFVKGKTDFNGDVPRDFGASDAYQNADRGYSARLGTLVEYKEGYRIGFELGYGDGYFGRPYTISIPVNLNKAVVTAVNASNSGDIASNNDQTRNDQTRNEQTRSNDDRTSDEPSRRRPVRAAFAVPDGIQMKLRLTTQINTKTNREGDRFTAVVLDPSDYADAIVEGHIAKLNKSGKASGKTELSFAFDSIRTRDGRTGLIAGQVEKVYESETVKTVDEEGNVQSGSRTKDTATRTVGGGVLGAVLGGVIGGGKGAAIGAVLGAGVGAGSVMVGDGKDLVLDPGTELLIRTAAPER